MNDEKPGYYKAIRAVVIVDKCVTCGASVTDSLDLDTECVREGHGCYFEVHAAPDSEAELGEPR
jgi:hypothetical protein